MTIPNDNFSNFIFLSFMLHLGVFTVFTVKILVFPSEIPNYQQSVRIDIIALPEKENFSERKIRPKTKKKIEKQIKKQVEKQSKLKSLKLQKPVKKQQLKEEQSSAIARLKALKNLEARKKTKKQEYKGNAISQGASLSGLEKLHHESYLNQLDRHIRHHWSLPEWLTSANLSARVLIRIDKKGGILSKNLILKSGNEFFDQNVFKTLEKANPLPPPPANLADFYFTRGVEFRFPE